MKLFRGYFYFSITPDSEPDFHPAEVLVDDGYIVSLDIVSSARTPEIYYTPGLVDLHCHVGMNEDNKVLGEMDTRQQLIINRDSGVLLIRDAGMRVPPKLGLKVAEDLPILIHCGRHIALAKRYLPRLPLVIEHQSELVEAVIEQAKIADGWVKLVADWIDRSLGVEADLLPLWDTAALKDAITAAHELGVRVTAHAFSHSAIDGLLEAEVDCIEHGSGMDENHISECARRGVPVVPTLMQIELFDTFAAQAGQKYPVYRDTMQKMFNNRRRHFEMFLEGGLTLLPGTDSGGYQKHGSIAKELQLWLENGMSEAEILASATVKAYDFLGVPCLTVGARADLLKFVAPPRMVSGFCPDSILIAGQQV